MRKIIWTIVHPENGPQYDVVSNTRAGAIIKAEDAFLELHSWANELLGTVNDDGTLFVRPTMPAFTAIKVNTPKPLFECSFNLSST